MFNFKLITPLAFLLSIALNFPSLAYAQTQKKKTSAASMTTTKSTNRSKTNKTTGSKLSTQKSNNEKAAQQSETKSLPDAVIKVVLIDEQGLREILKPQRKPLLVNFWATWCDACREEFPDLVKISNDYAGKIDVVTVSLDDPIEINRDVLKFLTEMNAKMPAYLLKTADENLAINIVSPKWQGGLPFTILFSSDGEEVYSRMGRFNAATLRQQIENLLTRSNSN